MEQHLTDIFHSPRRTATSNKHLEHDTTSRPHIDERVVCGIPHDKLWRPVPKRANFTAHGQRFRGAGLSRQPKVSQLQGHIFEYQQVARLEIEVEETALMGGGHACTELAGESRG